MMQILQVVLWLFCQGWQPPGLVYYGQALLFIHAYFVGMLLFTSCDCGIYGITVFAVRYLHAVYEMLLLDSFIVLCCGMLFNLL